jgi:hypothetical protein
MPALKFGIVCRRLSEKIGAQGQNRSEAHGGVQWIAMCALKCAQ